MRKGLGLALPLTVAMLGGGAAAASAATVVVDNTPASVCKKAVATYSTIQDAVDASVTNGTVIVCPGTYPEQVTITTNGLKLLANTNGTPLVTPPAPPDEPADDARQGLVEIDGANNVQVRGLVLRGASPEGTDVRFGVYVHGGATNARIVNNRIADILSGAIDPPPNNSSGIVFSNPDADPADGDTGIGIAQDNVLTGLSFDGITVTGPGPVNLTRNAISQPGLDGVNVYGIDLFAAQRVTVLSNTVSGHERGISASGVGGGTMTGNVLTGNATGLFLQDTTGVTAKSNRASANGVGFALDSDAVSNLLQSNKALDNSELDCSDASSGTGTGGTANTWKADVGALADPDPICN